MTLLSIFEYMIGNTDWAVVANHNIKLILPAWVYSDRPFPVPYDFDYSGLVNAHYALADERLQFTTVKERQYLGYPRTYDELDSALKIFREKRLDMYALIDHFDLLSAKSKGEMKDYLEEFYKMILNPRSVRYNFIESAIAQ